MLSGAGIWRWFNEFFFALPLYDEYMLSSVPRVTCSWGEPSPPDPGLTGEIPRSFEHTCYALCKDWQIPSEGDYSETIFDGDVNRSYWS